MLTIVGYECFWSIHIQSPVLRGHILDKEKSVLIRQMAS